MEKFTIKEFYPWVRFLANKQNRSYASAGILDSDDLYQTGLMALDAGWKKVNWKRIQTAKGMNGDRKMLWSFLKQRIVVNLIRERDRHSNIIKVPFHVLEEAKKNQTSDHKLVDCKGAIFDEDFMHYTESPVFYNDHLRPKDVLREIMSRHISKRDQLIIETWYGMNHDGDQITMPELGEIMKITTGAASQLKQRALDKLRKAMVGGQYKSVLNRVYGK